MSKPRLIAKILVLDGYIWESKNYKYRYPIGDFYSMSEHIKFAGYDEVIIIDISGKTLTDEFFKNIEHFVQVCNLPLAVGGSIRNMSEIKRIFQSGADKVFLRGYLFNGLSDVRYLVSVYGKQAFIADLVIGNQQNMFKTSEKLLDFYYEKELFQLFGEFSLSISQNEGEKMGYGLDTNSRFLPNCILGTGFYNFRCILDSIAENVTGYVIDNNVFYSEHSGLVVKQLIRNFLGYNLFRESKYISYAHFISNYNNRLSYFQSSVYEELLFLQTYNELP